jgi:transposase InsO family protein
MSAAVALGNHVGIRTCSAPGELLPVEESEGEDLPACTTPGPFRKGAALLDERKYLCSIRTMYRILEQADELKERRRQVCRPHYAKPELLATGPNQVWSWDITKLKGPAKWTYYYLYVIMDIFSRYVVGSDGGTERTRRPCP